MHQIIYAGSNAAAMSDLSTLNGRKPALLALADGTIFPGYSIGVDGKTVGEVVFNTAMTGYQEILTDPSYAQQIVTLTYPHIGNVGVNPDDQESDQIWPAGLVIRELSPIVSNWRARQSLSDYLIQQNTVAIAGIDTRMLTHRLRDQGAQSGCILVGEDISSDAAIAEARKFPGLEGADLASVVSTKNMKHWEENVLELSSQQTPVAARFHVVVYDFGVKRQILRWLVHFGCRVTLIPAKTPASDVLALKPDGVVLSNGPGDPAACHYAIDATKRLLEKNVPILGICLGFQLLGLACGARTVKMKFGHHGANHPVQEIKTGRVFITSQNHGFAVDEASLPKTLRITHRSLFDGSLQGFAHNTQLAMAFQGHPEASPGPQEMVDMFREFMPMMEVSHSYAEEN